MKKKTISRNPYHTETNELILRPSALVLMDILGYQDMTMAAGRAGQQQQFLKSLYGALVDGRRWFEDPSDEIKSLREKDFFALKAFTDNIAIGFPISGDGEIEVGHAIEKVAEFQFNMAINGFFVRGAIAVGDAYVDDIAVVGGALIEAYEGEAQAARDPRVILTASAVEMVKRHLGYYGNQPHAPQARDLLQDSDGQWFVNYLEEILIAEHEQGPFYREFLQHKAAVETKLDQYKDRPTIFAKYAWVAGYHNFFCDLHSEHFGDEHRIATELFRAKPKLIV